MSQHDYNLADQAGAAFLADLNALALAIASLNSGSSEPATMFAFMLWADSGSGFLKQRNSGNTGWNIVGKLNTDMLASIQQQAFNSCAAGGSPNAITGSFSPAIAVLADRMFLNVAASAANTSSIVTFTPANGVITAKDVVKGVGTALAVGDIAGAGYPCVFQYNLALDKWILLNPASGVNPTGTGAIVQVVNSSTSAVATTPTTIPRDDTIPQSTEGAQFLSVSITPTNASNLLKIQINLLLASGAAGGSLIAALFKDSATDAIAATSQGYDTSGKPATVSLVFYVAAGSTSVQTYKVRAGCDTAGTTTLNGSAGARLYGGVAMSSITIEEIKA